MDHVPTLPVADRSVFVAVWQIFWVHTTTGAVVNENPVTDTDIGVLKRRRDLGKPYLVPQLLDDNLDRLPGGQP